MLYNVINLKSKCSHYADRRCTNYKLCDIMLIEKIIDEYLKFSNGT